MSDRDIVLRVTARRGEAPDTRPLFFARPPGLTFRPRLADFGRVPTKKQRVYGFELHLLIAHCGLSHRARRSRG
jgi:hypothetical protein